MTTFREFWARSAHFGQNGGWDKFRGARVFLCGNPELGPFGNYATADFHQIWLWNVVQCFVDESGKTFSKIATKSDIEIRSNRHFTQSRLQVTGCTAERYCLLRVVVQGPGNDELFSPTYGCGATGCQSCPNFGFWRISQYKTSKTYLPVTNQQPRGYIAEWLRFFHVVVEGPKGCLPAAVFSCDFW